MDTLIIGNQTQETKLNISPKTHLVRWAESFLLDRKAQNLTKGSLKFYNRKLTDFVQYCHQEKVIEVTNITPDLLRYYLISLEELNHNEYGIHGYYRTIKAFLRWFENEEEPENWKNPIRKVKAPKVSDEPLDPVEISDIELLMSACDKSFTGLRDKAIFLTLLDTGARASELLDIHLADIDFIGGNIMIRKGKGRKARTVFFGTKTKKAIRAYLKLRQDNLDFLWVRDDGLGVIGYDGLRAIVTRRAKSTEINPPSLHSFRRAFAINMLRAGVDLITLAKLMGHSGITVLKRYLKHVPDELKVIHKSASPVDNNL